MFNAKVLAVKNLMVLGKLLILVASSPVIANELDNPKFFEYSGSGFVNRLSDLSFGWFRTLKGEEHAVYHQSLTHAVFYAENKSKVIFWLMNPHVAYFIAL
jgi:hypothetical protein